MQLAVQGPEVLGGVDVIEGLDAGKRRAVEAAYALPYPVSAVADTLGRLHLRVAEARLAGQGFQTGEVVGVPRPRPPDPCGAVCGS